MINIKLPGNLRTKKIILMILVLIAIAVIANNGMINLKNDKIKAQSEKIEESFIKASEDVDNGEENSIVSEEEQKLYDEAYNLFFSKNYSEAIIKANQLIRDYPDSYMGYNIRGIAKAYNGDFNGGMDDIDKSISINDNYGYALFNKALSYELYGDMDNALEWYKKSLELEEYVWSYYGIASIYGRKGEVENTMKYLNKAIEMDSNVKETAKNEEDFRPVMNSTQFQEAVYN